MNRTCSEEARSPVSTPFASAPPGVTRGLSPAAPCLYPDPATSPAGAPHCGSPAPRAMRPAEQLRSHLLGRHRGSSMPGTLAGGGGGGATWAELQWQDRHRAEQQLRQQLQGQRHRSSGHSDALNAAADAAVAQQQQQQAQQQAEFQAALREHPSLHPTASTCSSQTVSVRLPLLSWWTAGCCASVLHSRSESSSGPPTGFVDCLLCPRPRRRPAERAPDGGGAGALPAGGAPAAAERRCAAAGLGAARGAAAAGRPD